MIVWANCHGGFVAGIAFAGALATGLAVDSALRFLRGAKTEAQSKIGIPLTTIRLAPWLVFGLVVLGMIAAACINPNGPRPSLRIDIPQGTVPDTKWNARPTGDDIPWQSASPPGPAYDKIIQDSLQFGIDLYERMGLQM